MIFTFLILSAVWLSPAIYSSFASMMKFGCPICLLAFLVLQSERKLLVSPGGKNETRSVVEKLSDFSYQDGMLVFVEKRGIILFAFCQLKFCCFEFLIFLAQTFLVYPLNFSCVSIKFFLCVYYIFLLWLFLYSLGLSRILSLSLLCTEGLFAL